MGALHSHGRLTVSAVCLAAAGLAASLPMSAALPEGPLTVPIEGTGEFVIQSWQVENGLPQGSVMTLLQSRAGDLWFGTQNGLVRFDGLVFEVFDRSALPNNFVRALAEDPGGTLWVGTSRGLSRRRDNRFRSYTSADGLAGDNVTALAVDAGGTLWIGTDRGLTRLSSGQFTTLRSSDGLAHDAVTALTVSDDGTLWVGTRNGLSRLSGDAFTTYTTREGLPHEQINALALDHEGRLWAGTAAGPPVRLDADGRRFRSPLGAGWTTGAPQALWVDRKGRLWCGTRGALVLVDGGRVKLWTTAAGLSDDHILSLFEDREGSVWIGTERGGLNRFKPPRLVAYTSRHGLPEDTVLSVIEDGGGDLWLGTWRGLSRVRQGEVHNYDVGGGVAGGGVIAIEPARAGGLWLGHMRTGVSYFADGKARRMPLPQTPAFALHEDEDGTLWVGTDNGLLAWRDGRVTRFTRAQGLPADTVFRIVPARHGGLWIATRGGVARVRGGRIEPAAPGVEGMPDESVVSLLEDRDGTLWIGTFGSGLVRLRAGIATAYTRRQGLLDDTVYEILDDGRGSLWTSSNRGPSRVRRADIDDYDAGRVQQLTPTVFGRSDGMLRVECNGGSQPVGWRGRDGRLWFATVGGAVAFDPQALRDTPPPPARIAEVRVDREALDLRAVPGAPLPPSRGDLEFHYSARTLTDPEKVRFRYRLDGFDDDWKDAGARRIAIYTNVPPGSYRFEVDAAKEDGPWSGRPDRFELTLRPQFYQTTWFRALPLFVLALAGWGLHQRRMRRFEAQAAVLAERHRMACELHDGLAQELSGLVRQLEVAQAELPPEAKTVSDRLHRARDLARASLSGARRSVRALRPETLEKAGLIEALAEAARQAVAGSDIRLDLEVTGTPRALPPETEQHLFRTGQEALNNAVRHAGASSIRVHLDFRRHTVRVRVSDDGRGLPASSAAGNDGFGIRGMRERMRLAGGKLRFISRAGQGTEVAALVPVDRRASPRSPEVRLS